jgi:hypothetical protein
MHGGMALLAMDLAGFVFGSGNVEVSCVRVFGNLANNLDMVRPEGSICTYLFVRDKIWLF